MDEYDLRRLPAYREKTLKLDRDELLALVPDAPAEEVDRICAGEERGD